MTDASTKSSSTSNLLGDASKTLAWNLHVDTLEQTKAAKNYVVSPYSLTAAFAMATLGARGATHDELLKGLGLSPSVSTLSEAQLIEAFKTAQQSVEGGSKSASPKKQQPGTDSGDNAIQQFELHAASKLYLQKDFGVSKEYVAKLAIAFSTKLEQVDFKAGPEKVRQQINAFVEEVTREKIKDLIPEGVLNELVRLVLISAVYMKADWQEKFDKHSTNENGEFYVAHSKRTRNDVPMMTLKKNFAYAENDVAQFVWLPYRGGEATMILAVPKARDGGLKALQAAVGSAQGGFNGMLKVLKKEEDVQVLLTMPRFKVETSFDLNDVMQRLGVVQAFDQQRADFGDMVQNPEQDRLYIGKALQKVYIKVDENGTEAAAATAVIMMLRSCFIPMEEKVVTVKADRPFAFWVEHKQTGVVLFNGAIVEP